MNQRYLFKNEGVQGMVEYEDDCRFTRRFLAELVQMRKLVNESE
jgi:hypothetical protein